MFKTGLIIILLLFSIIGNAQNTMLLTNGKSKLIGEYKLDNNNVIVYKNQKGKIKSIDKFDVFSINNSSNEEIVIYKKDSAYSDAFNIDEMRAFVQGQKDAHEKFKTPLTTVGGIVVSGVSSVFINPMFVIAISGSYTGVIGLTKASKKKIVIPNEFKDNKQYILGFKKSAKRKRIRNAIIGSAIGLVIGGTTFVATKQ